MHNDSPNPSKNLITDYTPNTTYYSYIMSDKKTVKSSGSTSTVKGAASTTGAVFF